MIRLTFILTAIAFLMPVALAAQRGRSLVEEGNRLYRDQRFEEAHQKYLDALREAPESDLIRFNAGTALYKNEDYQRAVDAYRGAIESGDPSLQAQAWYNLGNAMYQAQQLDAAGEAFKQSLRLNPTDSDAKHNLERVLEQQEQQQSQKGQQGQGGQQGENDQQQQPQQDEEGQQGQDGQQQEGQDEQQQQQPPQQGQQNDQQDQQQGQRPQGSRPQMTQEEAERLLQAIQEDPSKIERQRNTTAARRSPRKKW